MSDRNPLLWTETSPNLWRRGVDEVEMFWSKVTMLHDSNGRKPFELTGHVSIDISTNAYSSQQATNEVETALSKAWRRIRYDHPTIASRVQYDPVMETFYKEYCGIQGDDDLEKWLEATLVHVTGYWTGAEFANSDPVAPDLPTLFIVRGPASVLPDGAFQIHLDLVLRAGHDTIDGAGAILLFGNLLRHASDALDQGGAYQLPHLDGSEAENLSPPYRVAAGIPDIPTPAIQTRIDKMFSEHVHYGPSAGSGDFPFLALPFKNSTAIADKHQRVELIVEGDIVDKVLAACKNAGATITHIFHAAIPIAMRDLSEKQSEPRTCNYVHDLVYNLRSFCEEPYNTSAHPVTAYHSGATKGWRVPMIVPSTTAEPPSIEERKREFTRVLTHARDYYTYVRKDTDQKYLAPYCWAGHLNKLSKVPKNPLPGPPAEIAPSVSISSLGKLDGIIPQQIGQIRVSDPWVTGEEMSNGYGLFLVTHGSRMSFACAYNVAWHDREDALDFLQRCKALVLEFLGIST